VRQVWGWDLVQVALVQNEDGIEALVPHGADEAFRKRMLPRTPRRREDFSDARALDTMSKRLAVDSVAEKVGWRGVVREGLHDLLGRPLRGGMLGDVEVDGAPPLVGQHDRDD